MKINNTTFNSASLAEVSAKDHPLVKIGDERAESLKINNDFTYEKSPTLSSVSGRNNTNLNKLFEVLEKIQKLSNIVFTSIRAAANFISNKTSDVINYLSKLVFEETQIMDTSIPAFSRIHRSPSLPDLSKYSSEDRNEKLNEDLLQITNLFEIVNTAKNNNQVVDTRYLQCDLKMGYSSALHIMKLIEKFKIG